MKSLTCLVLIVGTAALCGCTGSEPPVVSTDVWTGRWNGPEGTYLEIAGDRGTYEITVRDLDGARTFAGTARDGRIEFQRDGVRETLRATDGEDTGMKWLAGKQDCLTIKLGEGFCRD